MAKSFEQLDAWKHAINLAVELYQITNKLPKNEIYGITSQIRRAVVSISSNIAEGSGVGSNLNYIHHLKIAIGSLNEVENLIIIATRLKYIKSEDFKDLDKSIKRIRKLIYGLINYLKKQN